MFNAEGAPMPTSHSLPEPDEPDSHSIGRQIAANEARPQSLPQPVRPDPLPGFPSLMLWLTGFSM